MSQYLTYATKKAISEKAKENDTSPNVFFINHVQKIQNLYNEFVEEEVIVPNYAEFEKDFLRKVGDVDGTFDLFYLTKDGYQLNFRHIAEYKRIPEGRSLIEVVAMIYYIASCYNLVKAAGIKYSPTVFEILSSPKEVIDPDEFDWDMAELSNNLLPVLGFSCFLDYRSDGSAREDD